MISEEGGAPKKLSGGNPPPANLNVEGIMRAALNNSSINIAD